MQKTSSEPNGDQIMVGIIGNSSGVAVGRGAQATVTQMTGASAAQGRSSSPPLGE